MPKLLNQMSGMPQMAAAFAGWAKKITLTVVSTTISDGLATSTESDVAFQGVIQPLTAQELKIKPEGQRTWIWLMIHCFPGTLNLTPADVIVYNGTRYKVMEKKDYSLNNYIEYHVVQDFQS